METKDYTLIFLFATPSLQVDKKKFRLLELKKQHFNTIICDISPIIYPQVDKAVTAERLDSEYFEKLLITKKEDLKKFISSHAENCFYLPMFDDYYDTRNVYRLFRKYNIKYGYVNGLLPDLSDANSLKIQFAVNKFTPKHLRGAFYNRIWRKINSGNPAKLFFYANDITKDNFFWRGNNQESSTLKIPVHSFDFDNFLAATPDASLGKYVLFLDTYFPYHPDFISTCDCDVSDVSAENYFNHMNAIFDEIEKQFGYKVLIAAHPRANYNDKEFSFKKENIYYGKTTELVKGAEFLLGVGSTTNMMAVMSHKPLVIIVEDEVWNKKMLRDDCIAKKEYYACELIRHIDEVKNLTLKIDEDTYQNIRKTQLCSDNATSPDLWQKIINYIDAEMEQ